MARRAIISTMSRRSLSALGCSAAVLVFTMSAATQDRFPNGPGKAEIVKVCSGCHEPDNVFAYPQTAREWAETLQKMAQLGAEATPDEWRLIEQYLDANLALIPINAAPVVELQRTMDVTQAVADAIVTYRKEKGGFKSVDDVKKVPGVDATKVDARKDRLVF
jgi:competence protein ComEA